MSQLYSQHVRERQAKAEAALAAAGFDAMVLQSGAPFTYHADDQDAPFHTAPHFAHWVPMEGPRHLLLVRPGKRPLLVRVAPDDYWYEQAPLGSPSWARDFDLVEVKSEEEAWKHVESSTPLARAAYVGDSPATAAKHGIAAKRANPPALISRLDWDRSFKTPYEVECLEEATRMAARGHAAARAAFLAGASEIEIHQTFVAAVGCVDEELPYGSIVALDEKGATLHYQRKRTHRNGKVLLIDSGARHLGYGSDITRTWTARDCDETFQELVRGLDDLQQELCAIVKPGMPYGDVHHASHVSVGDLLNELGVITKAGEEAVTLGLTSAFYPHGVGHFLGIQVHDVSGRQKGPEGGTVPPPPQHPFLRTTRTIAENQVFTIEPGIYFIEMLLGRLRKSEKGAFVDWKLVDRLAPCGGARIEDNVVVTKDGHRNLTRPYVESAS
ncbi:MAG: Xaa-Pro dipeptidase [Planctomycetota bacterium]